MSVQKFCWLLHAEDLGKNDKTWIPIWLRRYAATMKATSGRFPVYERAVICFLQGCRLGKRMHAVRAVKSHRDLVLTTGEPSLQ